ncbi:TetR/AcrR family transcriptional regulator [Parasphingopyxis lamellibrachiae]|uniref:TetR family transcriptional regulator n=1 Tax=Parasphingopyxis lamellibrachiae TaxID=680125 RepID=A0A3D9FGW1_9SPHN|nr:TetR/AcrR family transcriptional regulator [Parasphingopyxis lamellibrachiae]RED16336.1 TetR family transcriptional regulator [Parasphingopyxis lamellibrachiae]
MSALETQLAPRKVPQQQRAQFTVDCILKAAESIILKSGYDAATTNNIAEVAGVSIGSLYQYFASKEAIAAALVESAVMNATEVLRDCLIENMTKPLDESAREIIRSILETRKRYSFIFLRLPREVPKLGRLSRNVTTEKFLYNTIRAYYQQHRTEIMVADLEVAMFVAEHIIIGSIDAYLDNNAPVVSDEQLIEQLSDAFVKYLTK